MNQGYEKCNFAIGFHASGYNMLRNLYGEDYIAIFNNVTTDVLYLNSQAEPPENREGGLQLGLSIFFLRLTGFEKWENRNKKDQILGEYFHSKDYEQEHGFVTRGDLSDPNVKQDVDDALEMALNFALERK